MRLLLDTHALLWFVAGDGKLSMRASKAIMDPANIVFANAVSAIEIATKHRIGKLPGAGPLANQYRQEIEALGFLGLPVGLDEASLAGSMRHAHRDPFDRLLIAQALAGELTLVSNEKLFDEFGVQRLW